MDFSEYLFIVIIISTSTVKIPRVKKKLKQNKSERLQRNSHAAKLHCDAAQQWTTADDDDDDDEKERATVYPHQKTNRFCGPDQ